MKYVFLVSHGTFAPGLHNALNMLAGENREDVISTSLENGMSSAVYAENVRKCLAPVKAEDEIILLADLVGGSPLTTAADRYGRRRKSSVCIERSADERHNGDPGADRRSAFGIQRSIKRISDHK